MLLAAGLVLPGAPLLTQPRLLGLCGGAAPRKRMQTREGVADGWGGRGREGGGGWGFSAGRSASRPGLVAEGRLAVGGGGGRAL